jgi:predicted nucleic acid-binding Zn ribbon protein
MPPHPRISRVIKTGTRAETYWQNITGKTLFTQSPKAGIIGDLMTEIPPHKHCLVCGNAVRPDENFCDELCGSKFRSAQRKQQLLFVAFIVIMGLVLFLPSILKMKG